ncbi:MAG: hypothetical protein WC889_11490, partial [Myxococcota bacterium]
MKKALTATAAAMMLLAISAAMADDAGQAPVQQAAPDAGTEAAPAVQNAPAQKPPQEDNRKRVALSPGPDWKILSFMSGKDSYYEFMEEENLKLIRATYTPPKDTVILYRKLKK